MSHPAFTSVVVAASSDLGDDLAEAFGVSTVAAIVGGILGSRLEDVAGIPSLSRVALPDTVELDVLSTALSSLPHSFVSCQGDVTTRLP
jgi:hypothetical protein